MHPFIRVMCGVPISWDTNTAARLHYSRIKLAVWSPCNKFIAVALWDARVVDILDSATLQHLQTLESPLDMSTEGRGLAFSPDSCILTYASRDDQGPLGQVLVAVSWDLQTGGVVSTIRQQGPKSHYPGRTYLTYSADGGMVGLSYHCWDSSGVTVNIFMFSIATGTHTHTHSLSSHTPVLDNIWAQGESFWFTTTDEKMITIWEVGLTLGATPTKVETLPVPCSFEGNWVKFLPTQYRLAVVSMYRVQVWDVWKSRCLLDCRDTNFSSKISVSPDGCFIACLTAGSEIYLWKESPAGYILHGKLLSTTGCSGLHFSQDGKSIVTWGSHTVQLWCTGGVVTPPPTKAPKNNENFLLDFSPDGTVVATAMQRDSMVTVLNVTSGVLQLTINAEMEVYGLRVVESRVFVIGQSYVVTWNLPTNDHIPNARVDLSNSTQTVVLHNPSTTGLVGATISSDTSLVGYIKGDAHRYLYTCNLSTGEYIEYGLTEGNALRFSPDGCNIWCADNSGEVEVWRVGSTFHSPEDQGLIVGIGDPPEGYPWESSYGYWITSDWWILGPDGKRLLMLPPPWQSHVVHQMWKGQFLTLLHGGLPETVILDLNP